MSALLATRITDFSLRSNLLTWWRMVSATTRELSSLTAQTTTNPCGLYLDTNLSNWYKIVSVFPFYVLDI